MKLTFPNRIMLTMLLLITFTTQANDLGALPKKIVFDLPVITTTAKTYENIYNKKPVLKVCACQLLTVKTKNQEAEDVAVFSEKTNNGDLTADFAVAVEVLEKEKKHMKSFFF